MPAYTANTFHYTANNIWQRCDKLTKLVGNTCKYHMLTLIMRGLMPIFVD